MLDRTRARAMKVTAIVAHPDDEVLGVGGALARHVLDGDDVKVIVVCANTFREYDVDWETHVQHLSLSMQALGITEFICLEHDDQQLDRMVFTNLMSDIASEVGVLSGIVYTHWHKDLNRDHRVVNEAVQVIARSRGERVEFREFPTQSSSEYNREPFVPNLWIDISRTVEKKVAALDCYPLEIQPDHLPRNGRAIRDLAAVTGRQVGLDAAEVCHVVRRVI